MFANYVERALRRKPRDPNRAHLRKPPQLSRGVPLPLVGHTPEFLTKPLALLTRAHEELGEVAALQVGPKHLVCLFGPEGHEAAFRAPDEILNAQDAYGFMTPIFGEGVVYDASLETMGEQVKMLLPALKDRRMRTYTESIVYEVEQSIASWGDEGVVDLVDYCRVLTNYTSSRCLLGPEFRGEMSEEFSAIYHDLERGITPIAYLNPYLPLPAFRRRDQARKRLVELVERIVQDRKHKDRVGEDFLQTLIDARYSDGRPLTGDEITGLLLAAMFAGHHTSSVTTAWTLLEVLRDRSYLSRMVSQMDAVYADRPISMNTLREIPLTEYAVKEALRMHPPLFLLIRVAQTDWQFRDYEIPKGTWVIISPTVSHLSERYFRSAHRFDPDRFSPAREGEFADWSYIPFGGGRHKCLGNAFALLQIKTILSILLTRYEFDLHGDAIADDYQSMVIGPKEPCRLRYRRRVNQTKVPLPRETEPVEQAKPKSTACPFHVAEPTPPVAPKASIKLHVHLDKDLCQGHAVCAGEAPTVFEIGEDNKVHLRPPEDQLQEVLVAYKDQVLLAQKFCPNGTITVTVEDPATEAT